MDIELHQRLITDRDEAMHLTCFDHEHVAGSCLERLTLDRPTAAAGLNELDFIVRMPMRSRPAPGLAAEEKNGDADIPVIRSHELV